MPLEAGAAACNLAANAVLLRRALRDARGPVPLAGVGLQLAASALWAAHAALVARDPYLLATAAASGAMQLAVVAALWRAAGAVRAATSETRLPCLPPPG